MNASATKQERIKLRILVPLILAIAILLTTFGLAINAEQRRATEGSLRRLEQSVQRLVKDDQTRYIETMSLTIQTLLNDDTLADALRDQNRKVLLERTKTLFENLERVHRVTHFYFHSPDRANVLRVHTPAIYGDKIEGVVLAAAESRQTVSGLQQGRFGAYVVRVVSPWIRDGRLLGYVELGVDFEDVIKTIHKELDVDLFVAVDKTVLKREQWGEPLRQSSWDRFPYVVVGDQTRNEIPEVVRKHLLRHPAELAGTSKVVHSGGRVNELFFLCRVVFKRRQIEGL